MRPTLITTIICLLAAVSCGKEEAPLSLSWDLSEDNDISRVDWPKKVEKRMWQFMGPGTLHIKARAGYVRDVDFQFVQVWRDGNEVRSICLFAFPGSVDQVYADATKMANDWDFPDRKNIESFLADRGEGLLRRGVGQGETVIDPVQTRVIEIQQSFDPDDKKPFAAKLVLGFPTLKVAPDATSQPAK